MLVVARLRWLYALRNLPLRLFAYILIGLVRVLPERGAYAFGGGLGRLIWTLFPRWRGTAMRNLELLFGDELSAAQRAAIGRESASHIGWYVAEFIRMGYVPVEQGLAMVTEVDGAEHLHRALEDGHGVIGLAMHYGNWDLSGAYLTSRIRQLYAVGKPQQDEFFTRIAFPWRARYGIRNIMSGNRLNSAILRALKENCVLGLLADQNGGTTGIFAPFAGKLASTVPGPAALALKTGAPLLVIYTYRLAPGRHKLVIKPPLDTSGLPPGKDEAMVELLGRINAAYVEVIRTDPAQWLLGHKRWKTRPSGEAWLY
jgi:KDO2-lipid IV(A) lauroyltransferase